MLLAALLLAGLTTGCAPRVAPEAHGPLPVVETGARDQDAFFRMAQERWRRFYAMAAAAEPSGELTVWPPPQPAMEPLHFSARASLNYASPEAKHRVVMELYGKDTLPLRMDVKAGVGALLALWREDSQGFLAYVPEHETAYLFEDSKRGMAFFGFELPYGLPDLASLIIGRWDPFVPPAYKAAAPADATAAVDLSADEPYAGDIVYRFEGPGGTYRLTLDADAMPASYESPPLGGAPGWTLAFSDLEATPHGLTPGRIRMRRPDAAGRAEGGERAILTVKEITIRETPWNEDALTLELPPGTFYARPEEE